MSGEIDALIRLLEDDSPTVITAVDDRLRELTPDSLPALRAARHSKSAKIRGRARELLRDMSWNAALERLVLLAQESNPELEDLAIGFGRLQNPELDVEDVKRQLDEIAAVVKPQVDAVEDGRQRIEAFLDVMHNQLGFHGDKEDFHNFENHFLHCALTRKKGLPITLIMLYSLIAKRVGMKISAIGTPNRALAHYSALDFETYIDAFDGGRFWTKYDCVRLLKRSDINERDTRHYLRRLSSREIAERIARNLIHSFSQSGRKTESQDLRRLGQTLMDNRFRDS